MGEIRVEVRRAIYVGSRDGELGAWLGRWAAGGYTMVDLGITERDKEDGQYGRAFEAKGPARVGD